MLNHVNDGIGRTVDASKKIHFYLPCHKNYLAAIVSPFLISSFFLTLYMLTNNTYI